MTYKNDVKMTVRTAFLRPNFSAIGAAAQQPFPGLSVTVSSRVQLSNLPEACLDMEMSS